ncbi:MAG TPA: CapA family protein [Steroidobacteraceae bacterium]|jgi:poly-gamma-glutamate synthesis protein (capsule biosynthesis protein)
MSVVLACGDVAVHRADCASMFAGCRDVLEGADLCIAQLEAPVSERGARVPNARLAMRSPIAAARAMREAGIDLVSCAGNHCLDFGYEALSDTLLHLRAAGMHSCGAGDTLDSALEPAYCMAGSSRVALVAACSILPEGYAARADRPGCAPLRAFTVYDPIEPDQPGTPPRTRSFLDAEDLAALVERIRRARAAADWVLVSLHWGIHMVPFALADYQRAAAHALIDAGADAILGHHPHLLKGIEVYRGRPVFYSLGNFAIEQPHFWDPAILHAPSFRHLVSLNPEWDLTRKYMLPENTRPTGLAKLLLKEGGRLECRFLPGWIAENSAPEMLHAGDSRFGAVRAFLEESSRAVGFDTRFDVEADELIVS